MVRKKTNSNMQNDKVVRFREEPDAISRLSKFMDARDYPQHYRKQVFMELIDFCKNEPRRLTIEQFCLAKGLHRSTVDHWATEDSWCNRMLNLGLSILGARRYEYAFFKEADKEIFKWNQHKYDPTAIECHQLHAALKNDEQKMGDIHVHIDEMPETDKVPKKDEK